MSVEADTFAGTERFAIQRCLGAGSFGTVYEAFDRERGAPVALKVLKQADPAAIYRFKKEFRALTGLTHPNLVELHELMNDGDRWFFTMELVDGVPFLASLRGDPRPPARARTLLASPAGVTELETAELETPAPGSEAPPAPDWTRLRSLFLQLAEGLSALHRAGRIHRDVKPENVLVARNGRVVILDFGLITDVAPVRQDRSSGLHAVGTPAYMSPEQARGHAASASSDWYSVGVMLYEALTGFLPFRGEPIEVLARKLHSEVAPPHERAPGIPDDLDRLCCQLLRRDEEERPSGAEVLFRLRGKGGAPEPPVAHGERSSHPAPFVGRKDQLAALHEAFARTKEGRAVTLLVRGPSGMGKSTLVRRFLQELAERDPACVVLAGRCYERESMPYKALDSLIDALTQYLRGLPPHEAEALLPRDVLTLARLFPVLRRVEAVSRARRKGPEIPDSQELRRRAVGALRELFERLSDKVPLVLVIDDLQWGDVDGASLLSSIVRPPDPPAFLLIGCKRSENRNGPASGSFLPAQLSSTEDDPLSSPEELFVEELPPEEAEELARRLLGGGRGAAEAARTIAAESRGNPLLLDELVHASLSEPGTGRAAGPPTLHDLIAGRVSVLLEDSRRLLEVLAVAGEPLERSVALGSGDLEGHAAAAVSALQANGLIRAHRLKGREVLETAHDQVRETVVRGLSPEAAKAHHRRLAHALEAWGLADPETLALHFHAAEEPEMAREYITRAARQASETLAFDRAARLYLSALNLSADESETRALRVSLGDALANAGRGGEAAEAYLVATRGASAAENLDLRRRAAEQFLRSGHVDQGLAAIRDVLKSVGMTLPGGPKSALLGIILLRGWIRIRGLGFRERDASQVSAERLMRIDVCRAVAEGLGIIDVIRGNAFQARQLLLALRAGEPTRVARALALEMGYSATRGGRSRRRTETLRKEMAPLVTRIGHPQAIGFATWASGFALYLEGRWKSAQELLEKAEGILRDRCTGAAWELHNAQFYSLRSLAFMGRFAELSRRLPSYLRDAQVRGDLYAETNLRARVSYAVLLALDRPEKARQEIREMLARWSHRGYHLQHYFDLFGQVEIDLYEGNARAAWDRVVSGWPALQRSLLRRTQLVFLESAHLRARSAVAAVAAGEAPERILEVAEREARRIEREAMPWSNPLAELIRASVAALRGDLREAVGRLASAETGFEAVDEGLYAAVAQARRGELLGGAEGEKLRANAKAWMSTERIVKPSHICRLVAPGRWQAHASPS
ncbi:MAG: protein kinase [Thermoanaerobaculia bacterium]